MSLHLILVMVLSADIMIFCWATATYFSNIATKPYIDAIERIGEMDIPIGEKIDMMNKVRPRR